MPKNFKIYSLSPVEQYKLDEFLKENLRKGYIYPSQIIMFVSKIVINEKQSSK